MDHVTVPDLTEMRSIYAQSAELYIVQPGDKLHRYFPDTGKMLTDPASKSASWYIRTHAIWYHSSTMFVIHEEPW